MDVKTIAVIGAGAEGRGIASLAARSGFRTILEDVSIDRLERGVTWIHEHYHDLVERKTLTPQQEQEALRRLATSRSIEDVCRQADLLIEASTDELETKLEIFTLFDKFSKPRAILASTTPSLSIADLAAITFRPEDCVGLRFKNPAADAGLLEIVRAPETSDATVAACREVGRCMGRQTTIFGELPTEPD
ncbi:MAG: 3-hydroxyacyl-CoA dehydrogenase family protein [Candidatus Acidiferrales bacterium]